jgi:putative ABC transport system substrate-binding protein
MSTRREFITLLGSAAAWPIAARAQQSERTRHIGLIGSGSASSQAALVGAFERRLRDLGWSEGRNVAMEYRWAEGRPARFAEIASEFVRLKVDIIFATGTEAALAAKKATTFIPIVFPVSGDPVGAELVTSLARPGGNVTGLSNLNSELAPKRLQIFRDVLPALRQMAVLVNANSPAAVLELREVQTAGHTLGIEVTPLETWRTDDIAPALRSLRNRAEALYVVGDPLMNFNRIRINTFALAARLPTMHVQREYVEAAGLMSYGPNFPELYLRAADLVDKLLRGAKPADLPVEQPTKFEFVVNLVTAEALDLAIPPSLLARADEVIE